MNLSKQRKAEIDYYREQFDLHQTDLKKSWKIIKKYYRKRRQPMFSKKYRFSYK